MTIHENFPVPVLLPPESNPLRLAVAAYLARFKGQSRIHTESDLRAFLTWCRERELDPLKAQRAHLELYVRWMQEIRRYKPSTVSRRMAVVAGFYRTCVIDTVLEHSPAEYVRRPNVPAESPTLGLTHLQFEAVLATARTSTNRNDFALVAMLGLLGLRIFEACGASIEDLGEEHGHRVLRVSGKGGKVVLTPLPPAVAPRSSGPFRSEPQARSCAPAAVPAWTGTAPPAACTASPRQAGSMPRGCTRTCCDTPSSPPCSMPASTCETCRSLPGTPTHAPPCATTEPVRIWTATPTTSSPPTWPPVPEPDPSCR